MIGVRERDALGRQRGCEGVRDSGISDSMSHEIVSVTQTCVRDDHERVRTRQIGCRDSQISVRTSHERVRVSQTSVREDHECVRTRQTGCRDSQIRVSL